MSRACRAISRVSCEDAETNLEHVVLLNYEHTWPDRDGTRYISPQPALPGCIMRGCLIVGLIGPPGLHVVCCEDWLGPCTALAPSSMKLDTCPHRTGNGCLIDIRIFENLLKLSLHGSRKSQKALMKPLVHPKALDPKAKHALNCRRLPESPGSVPRNCLAGLVAHRSDLHPQTG